MPQEFKSLLVSVVMLMLAILAGSLCVLLDAHPDWLAYGMPLMLTLALFLPADFPEEGEDHA